jgi:hypothetical protein
MTRSIAMNSKNDLYRSSDGNLALVYDQDAIMQNCRSAAQTKLGELIYDQENGVPMDQTIFDQWLPDQFEAAMRRVLTAVDGVVEVRAFSVTKEDDKVIYSATIQTIYSEDILTNG